jgi:RecA-family ATPase
MLEGAVRYAGSGFRVIPIKPHGKIPLTAHGAKDATTDKATIRAWWQQWPDANVAITLGGLVVVDVDPRNGGDVDALPGKLPDSCYARTGGGGLHYLYRAVNGTDYPGKLGPGIDLKSGPNAYVVVEPSVHPSGERYSWLDETEPWAMRPAVAPEWLGRGKAKAEPGSAARKIREGSRNQTLTSLGGVMRQHGMTATEIAAALLAVNDARCEPPLLAAEVRGIAASLGRYEAGRTPESEPAEWPAPLDLATLGATEPQPPRHVVPDWLPSGEVTLFAGHGGSGKSSIALHLAVCVALGLSWCGLATERRRVVYLSAEDGAEVLHWRLARIAAHLGIDLAALPGWLDVLDVSHRDAELMIEPGRGEEPILTALYDALRGMTAPDSLLILDGASDLYGGSEIIRRHVRRFVRALRRLVGPDGAVLLLAHIDKAAARNGAESDRYSGSTAWHNSVRARWSLAGDPLTFTDRAANDDLLVLALAKANSAKAGAEIRLRWDAQARLYVAEPAPADRGLAAAIRERLEREGILAAMRACAEAGIIVPAALQGPRTAHNVLVARAELPDSLRSGAYASRRFRARLEELRQIGAVTEREMQRSNRHTTLALVLVDRANASVASNSER